MRIAVSADNNAGLDSPVSSHFGRCPFFVLVDVEGQDITEVKAVDNPYYSNHAPGQVPAFIHSQGAEVILAGGMGHRAVSFFQQYGIQAVTGASGSVRQALQGYLGGELHKAEPCVEGQEHHHCDE
ncbi:MAG: NifB/NifX family molybdenum-iron cluster-binding protein [Anaerolineae bacterium]